MNNYYSFIIIVGRLAAFEFVCANQLPKQMRGSLAVLCSSIGSSLRVIKIPLRMMKNAKIVTSEKSSQVNSFCVL